MGRARDADQRPHAERRHQAVSGRQRPAGAEQQRLEIGMDAVGRRLEKDAPVPVAVHAEPPVLGRVLHETQQTQTERWVSPECSTQPTAGLIALTSIGRRIAAVGRIGDHLLERVAHRHIEVDVLAGSA